VTIIRRLDHPIVCVRDLRDWVPLFDRVLQLRPDRSRVGDEWGFSNAELAIGDGFLGVVEPAGEDSQLSRFLAKRGEGFYGLAVDVGDLAPIAAFLQDRGVRYREATRDGEVSLLWLPPNETHGVVYQLTPGMPTPQGANPNLRGVSEVVVAVESVDRAVETYRKVFDFDVTEEVDSAPLAYLGARLPIPGAALADALVLAEPTDADGPVARHLAARGEGMFEFAIPVDDLDVERRRLDDAAVPYELADDRLWVDPDVLRGVRIELRAAALPVS